MCFLYRASRKRRPTIAARHNPAASASARRVQIRRAIRPQPQRRSPRSKAVRVSVRRVHVLFCPPTDIDTRVPMSWPSATARRNCAPPIPYRSPPPAPPAPPPRIPDATPTPHVNRPSRRPAPSTPFASAALDRPADHVRTHHRRDFLSAISPRELNRRAPRRQLRARHHRRHRVARARVASPLRAPAPAKRVRRASLMYPAPAAPSPGSRCPWPQPVPATAGTPQPPARLLPPPARSAGLNFRAAARREPSRLIPIVSHSSLLTRLGTSS